MKAVPSVIVLAIDFKNAKNVTIDNEQVNPDNMTDGAVFTTVGDGQTVYVIDNNTIERPSFKKTLSHASNEIHTVPAGSVSTDIQTFPNTHCAYIAKLK